MVDEGGVAGVNGDKAGGYTREQRRFRRHSRFGGRQRRAPLPPGRDSGPGWEMVSPRCSRSQAAAVSISAFGRGRAFCSEEAARRSLLLVIRPSMATNIQLMKAHGTFYCPTVYTGQYVAEQAMLGAFPRAVAAKALVVGPQIMKTVSRVYLGGVKFAYGTDARRLSFMAKTGRDFVFW